MVGSDVEQDGDVGMEVVHVVELERAKLDDIVFVWILSHLQCERASDVACKSCVIACCLEDVVDERRGCGLAIRARNANHLGVGVASGKFYLADDVYSLVDGLFYHWRFFWYARAFYYFVGIKNALFGVLLFLPFNVMVVEHSLIFVFYCRHVAYEHVESFSADEIIKSPGIPKEAPMIQKIEANGIHIISEIEFAGRYDNAKKICITGSNGKTTTYQS